LRAISAAHRPWDQGHEQSARSPASFARRQTADRRGASNTQSPRHGSHATAASRTARPRKNMINASGLIGRAAAADSWSRATAIQLVISSSGDRSPASPSKTQPDVCRFRHRSGWAVTRTGS
jgi:hypothetical protein